MINPQLDRFYAAVTVLGSPQGTSYTVNPFPAMMTEAVAGTHQVRDWLAYRYCVSEIPLWTRCAMTDTLSEAKLTMIMNLRRQEEWLTVGTEFGRHEFSWTHGQRISNGAWWRVVTKSAPETRY